MDLQKELLESGKQSEKRRWKPTVTSIALHATMIAGILYAGQNVTHKVAAEKQIDAFISQGAAPPPPPPPPPPARSSSAPKSQPRVQPKQTPVSPTFTAPLEIPKEIPKVDLPVSQDLPVVDTPLPESTGLDQGPGDALAGVVGGVAGGVAGGVVGGVVGGEVGGEVGGVVGGQVGGTGRGTEGSGTGGVEAPVEPPPPPPPPPTGPLRVGGDVKAPVIVKRAEPDYTETARKARIAGVVIVEAIIDTHGTVDEVKVVKGLPMGLSEEAAQAVRRWKFKPGTRNGVPVATIFNLTVNFKLDG